MSVNFNFVGKRIKEERENKSYTQAELSEKAEMHSISARLKPLRSR